MAHTQLPARDVAQQSLSIAGEIDIYTNSNISIEEL
jgi:ATP-dependent HslUV protease subunit HslV